MRKFWICMTALLVLILGATFIIWMQLPQIVSYIISKQTKTHVYVEDIDFGTDYFVIQNLIIDSPPESSLQRALQVKELIIRAPYDAYVAEPLILNVVELNDIYLGIEFYDEKRTKGNWVTIQNNLDSADESKNANENSYALIREMILRNLSIQLKLYNQGTITLSPVKIVQFQDVRTDNGQIADELTQLILKKVMYTVFIMKGIQTVINIPKDVIDTVLMPFSWFGGGSKKNEQNAQEQNNGSGN